MLAQEEFALDDPAQLRELIAATGWATLVSVRHDGVPAVSHLPVIVDAQYPGPEIAVLGHLASSDAREHELGRAAAVLVLQGPHGYVSPRFYRAGPSVPTWNFVTVHLHGRPQVLDPQETYQVLSATVDHFEAARPAPFRLDEVTPYARRIAPGVTGLRMVASRTVGKAKLSQDKPGEVAERVAQALETDPVHGNPGLARAMRRTLARG
jgi:transcriptional regulator